MVTDVSAKTLRKAIADQVNMSASHLITDELRTYRAMGREFQSHETVNHSEGEYARGAVSINLAETFFSQLKRSIDGIHHHVTPMHLPRYLGEFDFRYGTCKMSDGGRMRALAKKLDGRLSYERLITT